MARLSAREPSKFTRRVIILFNGVPQRFVWAVDDERGYIDRYVLKDGMVQLDPLNPERAHMERLFGDVKIIDPDDTELLHNVYTRCDKG